MSRPLWLLLLSTLLWVSAPAQAFSLTSVSLNLGGRYLYSSQVGAQLEVTPFSSEWFRAEAGASMSYKDGGTIYALSAKLGPRLFGGLLSPFALLGATMTVFEALSATNHLGLGLQVNPIGPWFVSGEGVMSLFSSLQEVTLGIGIGYRL